ncbi:MAG TPA: HAD-IIA family hydrolase [Acidimicrobiia bacterium]|nr:HAD-IIA family hydrolase [Acidimicrobiia bacterium]
MASRVLAGVAGPGNVVLDLDGTLYRASEPIPGAVEAVRAIEEAGWRVVIATNNATRHRREVAEHVRRVAGLEVAKERVVTAADAAVRALTTDDAPVFVVGQSGLRLTLEEAGIELTEVPDEARSVVIGLDRAFDYDRLAAASRAVFGGARLVATNGDTTFPGPSGLEPGAGALVAAVAAVTAVTPTVAGKPNEPMREAVASVLGPGPTVVVGDRLDTDIAFGATAGWPTILVLTGVTDESSLADASPMPDLVIASLADLPTALGVDPQA